MTNDSLIARLFPPFVATAARRVGGQEPPLFPQELEYVEKAVEKRRSEFAAGRACAREALGLLGVAPGPILRTGEGYSPLWPGGIAGAISHSHTWAGAAVALTKDASGIGLDIETVDRVSMSIARKVLTPAEMREMERVPVAGRKEFLALVFSAKEAVYKCLAPLAGDHLGFMDADILRESASEFTAVMDASVARALPACARMTGRYFLHEGCVFTGLFLARLPAFQLT